MKDFSQYNSVEEVIQDMVLEGLIPRNRKIHKAYPSVKPAFSAYYVDKLKKRILERIAEAGGIHEDGSLKDGRWLSLTRICQAVRGDHYPAEFKVAIKQLVEERRISEEKQWSQKNKPCTYYHLFEF
ncbi:MAG: hypothetical protein WCA15_11825 [Candidatus Acidiferrales bacterium]